MTALNQSRALFFSQTDLESSALEQLVNTALHGLDDGELYLEHTTSESYALDNGRLRQASYNSTQGFGLRGVLGDAAAYAHGSVLSTVAIRRAADTLQALQGSPSHNVMQGQPAAQPQLYAATSPLLDAGVDAKVALLQAIDSYARRKDNRVVQVMASLSGEYQVVHLVQRDGVHAADCRPLVRLNVMVMVSDGTRQEAGSYGSGGRFGYTQLLQPATWQAHVDEALRQALVNLESIPAPAGDMAVVLGSGWPGVMLHEAVGHGLEGDFNRKQTSMFAGLLGQQVAAKGVTVVDDGTLPNRRGSLTIDDEGTPTSCTTLIEDGVLVGFMQDRMNARLMGVAATGNGRRESYAHLPMPRMTNTYMLNGTHTPEEIIASVPKGIYAKNFGGGQVDITSGKFVFSASEAYLIENGKITAPVKGATLVGSGADVMRRISMIGNDLHLDTGVGTCGKDGQSVPVGVGQPTLKIDRITVGGTAT